MWSLGRRTLLTVDEQRLRDSLLRLDPAGRDALRRLLIADSRGRDAVASRLLRHGTTASSDFADLLDMLTLDPDLRRRVVRQLGELEAREP
jgi:hypothetical protein